MLGFSLPPPNTSGSLSSRRSLRHTSPNSGSAIDDSFLAKMIFDDSSQFSPLVTANQKSPLYKSTSALHDVNELPRPLSPSAHRQLTGTRSFAYPPVTYLSESNRSFNSSYLSDINDSSYVGSLDRSPRSSVASLGSNRYDDVGLRGGNLTDDFLQHYTTQHNRQSSPVNNVSHGRSSLDSRISSHYTQPHMRSSPDSLYSPQHRSSYRSSAVMFSPEPVPPNPYQTSNTMRHSTHSTGTPPPHSFERGAPHHKMKDREMDLQEALMMDQDEGTLV